MPRSTLVIGSSIALALLLLGLTPKLVGMNLRDSSVNNLFALIPPEYERQLEVQESSFDSGWFGSNAEFEVQYSALGMNEPLSLMLHFDFDHGPVLRTEQGLRLGWAHARITPSFNSREITQALSEIPFELPEFTIDLTTGFDQTLTVVLNIAPASVNENGMAVSFDGLTGTLVAYPDQSANITLEMGAFSANEGANTFSIESLDLDSRTEQLSDLLAPSSAEVLIPTMSATGVSAFTATDISSLSRLSATPGNNEQINIYQQFRVAEVTSEFPLASLTWTSQINEVATALIRTYYELLASAQTAISGSGGVNDDANLDQLAQQLMLVLVQNSLVFNNDVAANIYGGDHTLQLLISWLGIPQAANVAALSMEDIIAALQAELHLSLDLQAMTQSPFAAMIDPYVQQGYITLDNGRVLLDISLADQQLVINGEVTPLGDFSLQQNL